LLLRAPDTRPWIVAVKHTTRGHRRQIRAIVVLDVWGGEAPADLVAATLAAHYAGRADALVFRCQRAADETALARAGFVRRRLDVPIGWTIDRAGHLAGRSLHL